MRKRILSLVLLVVVMLGTAFPQRMNVVDATDISVQEENEQRYMVSGIWINPAYEGVVTEDDLVAVPSISLFSRPQYETDNMAVALAIRELMIDRTESMTIYFKSSKLYQGDYFEKLVEEWISLATKDTSNPVGGDYLMWHLGGYRYSSPITYENNIYYYDVNFTFSYHSTYEQEKKLTKAVDEVLDKLGVKDEYMSDYHKTKRIYDYITQNIVYDYANLENDSYKLKYSAYAALVNKTAVCQGYANLLYRMLKEVGVTAHVIAGIGNGGPHGWNLIQISTQEGDNAYLADATWDAGLDNYQYFLKGRNSFEDHYPNEDMDIYNISYNDFAVVPLKSFALTHKSLVMEAKTSYKIGATILPLNTTDNTKVRWKSTNESIATVDNTGRIHALKEGATVIKATLNGITLECNVTVTPQILRGWQSSGGVWHYFDDDGTLVKNRWVEGSDGNGWYYLDENGRIAKNRWVKGSDGNGWYYLDEYGRIAKNRWAEGSDGKGWYYLDENGLIARNRWAKGSDGNGWYYLDENGLIVKNRWVKGNDGNGWYYLDANGRMAKNRWVKGSDGKGWYYLDENGVISKNRWAKDSKGWCYLDASGRMATNKWIKDSKGWCYVGADGYCVINTWKKDSKGWCYLDASGRMATNKWIKDSKGWCYVGANGYCITNAWKQDSKGWCYLDASGRMVTGWKLINNKWYYFHASGNMAASQWVGNYYLQSDGSMATNKWIGKYYVGSNGAWVKGK